MIVTTNIHICILETTFVQIRVTESLYYFFSSMWDHLNKLKSIEHFPLPMKNNV